MLPSRPLDTPFAEPQSPRIALEQTSHLEQPYAAAQVQPQPHQHLSTVSVCAEARGRPSAQSLLLLETARHGPIPLCIMTLPTLPDRNLSLSIDGISLAPRRGPSLQASPSPYARRSRLIGFALWAMLALQATTAYHLEIAGAKS